MFSQPSLFRLRYAGGLANSMRSRVMSIPTGIALRVPSARLSGSHHASTQFLTIGKAISIGLLGVVRVYTSIPISLPICFGPAWPITSMTPNHQELPLRHDHHQILITSAVKPGFRLSFTDNRTWVDRACNFQSTSP